MLTLDRDHERNSAENPKRDCQQRSHTFRHMARIFLIIMRNRLFWDDSQQTGSFKATADPSSLRSNDDSYWRK